MAAPAFTIVLGVVAALIVMVVLVALTGLAWLVDEEWHLFVVLAAFIIPMVLIAVVLGVLIAVGRAPNIVV